MIITGKIIDSTEDEILISAFFPSYFIEKRQISEVEITITDGRQISAEQRKKIYATIRDISLYTGHDPEELKAIFKADYIAKTGEKWLSLSDVDMTTACDFLQHLIEFCIDNGIPSKDSYLDRTPDIGRYLYRCLATRTCAICGKKAEVHHSGESKIGMGRNRTKIHHLGLQAVALCRQHHEFGIHLVPESEFYELHHIWAIRLDEYLCKKLGLKV
ncbi:MAG: hypothetical protein AWM53_02017 [Candidatus Dichloromethanomonas elyunquensis]|nr:MAG: hypothetical protein AWM53_02017 [Candidatus Dichloromethanomonas elyunquensis]